MSAQGGTVNRPPVGETGRCQEINQHRQETNHYKPSGFSCPTANVLYHLNLTVGKHTHTHTVSLHCDAALTDLRRHIQVFLNPFGSNSVESLHLLIILSPTRLRDSPLI